MQFKIISSLLLLGSFTAITPALAQFQSDRPSFFRDGYDLMNREIQNLQQQQKNSTTTPEHPQQDQLLTIQQGPLQWQKYLFRDGGFSIWMPSGIQSSENVVLETGMGEIAFEVFATHPQDSRFVAAYSENLEPDKLTNTEELLAAIRDGIITKTKYELTQENPVNFEEYSGTELTMKDESAGEIITFRVYLIGDRVHVLAVSQKNVDGVSEDVVNFFNSFRLLQ